ncbi:uncharacterized protein PV06_05358 [Exophiala oligosperma]|uniref:Oxidoreductase-like domain-containing protein n=1 Tax=Exophiala oligosperma TaxID=215243 RepID=A0A0D2E8X5_9EURO|nr:uncharacterized protein PV06_05358 [Exophiala oligosperma]KIW44344.1 hypothetical protein PV06_05358 [Exophiala oligosperma]
MAANSAIQLLLTSQGRWVCNSCLRQISRRQLSYRQLSSSSTTDQRRATKQARGQNVHSHSNNNSTQSLPRQRSFHSGTNQLRREHAPDQPHQAVPLGDFYTDLLSSPMREAPHTDHSALPTFVTTKDESVQARARKLFGTIEGSGYKSTTSETPDATWRTINGVPVPPRPAEPDNCCMSGCVHCVWDDYRDDVEAWAARVREAQSRKSPNHRQTEDPKLRLSRPEVHEASGSMDEDGGGSEGLWTAPAAPDDEDALFADIPVGIREFMATEKRIRERKRVKMQRAS